MLGGCWRRVNLCLVDCEKKESVSRNLYFIRYISWEEHVLTIMAFTWERAEIYTVETKVLK